MTESTRVWQSERRSIEWKLAVAVYVSQDCLIMVTSTTFSKESKSHCHLVATATFVGDICGEQGCRICTGSEMFGFCMYCNGTNRMILSFSFILGFISQLNYLVKNYLLKKHTSFKTYFCQKVQVLKFVIQHIVVFCDTRPSTCGELKIIKGK